VYENVVDVILLICQPLITFGLKATILLQNVFDDLFSLNLCRPTLHCVEPPAIYNAAPAADSALLQVLVTNILPPSSISLPLYAKYLLFTVIIDVCCIANTVIVLNCNFKTPRTHQMSGWSRVLLLKWLPRLLFMQRPGSSASNATSDGIDQTLGASIGRLPTHTPESMRRGGFSGVPFESVDVHHPDCAYGRLSTLRQRQKASEAAAMAGSPPPPTISPEINKAIEAVRFVGAHLKNEDDFDEVSWGYMQKTQLMKSKHINTCKIRNII